MNEPNDFNSGEITFDLGTFEGFNFREQSAIPKLLTAQEIIAWDHDSQGEAEFWPSGDKPEVSLLFPKEVTFSELRGLNRLLSELGNDSTENYLQIYYMLNFSCIDLSDLSAQAVQDQFLHIFTGDSFLDLRKEAAYELFELYYPEEYVVWEKSLCDGLIFDTDRFLDSPIFFVEEVTLGEQKALLVNPQ